MAGDAASRVRAVRCYGGFVAYGYDDEYDHGRAIAPPPPIFRSGKVDQYVYDEPDNDDYKVFPPPGPGTVIESTGHGYTIVPMTGTTCDKGDDDAPLPPVFDALFASIAGLAAVMAAERQRGTPVAAVEHGATEARRAAARPPPARSHGCTVAYGYDDGKDAAAPPVRPYSGRLNQYEYDEPDNDDYKVFPPPARGTVIDPACHGYTYTIVPMPGTTPATMHRLQSTAT